MLRLYIVCFPVQCGWGVLHHACAGGTGGGGTNCDILEWLFDHVPQLKTPEELNKQTKVCAYVEYKRRICNNYIHWLLPRYL